ncbi:cytidine deaminase [Pararhizobium mangrovi]|uniref:Cytidine deaminase n=2 Tax=Pararhizobium mangrovi TaxID=2590452 RepID=A0A506UH96_9HYPH|nr:cytidine deaminase [Pararhizobium mangrovi]
MLEERQRLLVDMARDAIRTRYSAGRHHVGCALVTRSGRIYTGVHLECTIGRITVCAEAVAIGAAATAGDAASIAAIVAVRQQGPDDPEPRIVSPCGMCREMIADYAPDAEIIVPGPDGARIASVQTLLPERYSRS